MNLLTLQLASKRPDISRAREGCVWRDLDGSVCGRSLIAGRDRWLDWFDVGVLAFNERSPVVRVWPVRGMTLESAREEFDRMLRPIVLQALGSQALHAGAALTGDGALLFCGRSGAGKSTTAYALGQMGCTQLADDQVVWQLHDGRPKVQALPFTPRLRPLSEARFTGGSATCPPWPTSQGLIPIAAIYLLDQRTDGRSPLSISRVPPAQAFSALLPHAHCFDLGDVEATRLFTDDYLTLASEVPVFSVRYSPNLDRLPELLHTIVSAADIASGDALFV
jgi:hypothetical protein